MKALVLAAALLSLFGSAGDPWTDQVAKLEYLLRLVKQHYPAPVDEKKTVAYAIRGLLGDLDPHSYFLDALSLRSLNDDQNGNFYGVGIRVAKYGNRLTVVAPLKGLPAERAGIVAGDVIVEIEGRKTEEMSLDTALDLLRGVRGTQVGIKIQRTGDKGFLSFRLQREFVPLESVTFALPHPLDPAVGYIGIRVFGKRTPAELQAALERLRRQGMCKLILDLRGNPGGSLEAAIETADCFLAKGKVIVAIRGRATSEVRYAQKDRQYEDLPLVALVNRSSASASEIVAAALQDNRRALIVGQRTFGKGLVETLQPLSFGCALALTTAKLYTPTSRLLQRDFKSPADYFTFTYSEDYESSRDIAGGVQPDLPVKPALYSRQVADVVSRGLLFDFSRRLAAAGWPVTEQFIADERVLELFRRFLAEKGIALDAADWGRNQREFGIEIERQILSDRFSPENGIRAFLRADLACLTALAALGRQE